MMKNNSDKHDYEVTDTICTCGEKHTGHICWLSRMGLFMEMQHLTDNPTVLCATCGAKANLPHNVCFPVSEDIDGKL